jgi:DnaJ-class molecular chaperone
MRDYYADLGVERDATVIQVTSAFERRMKKLGGQPDAERTPEGKRLKEAFAILSNPAKRADFDARLMEVDAGLAGSGSNAPLVIGIVAVILTVAGVGFFLSERSKALKATEQQRAAADREKAKR